MKFVYSMELEDGSPGRSFGDPLFGDPSLFFQVRNVGTLKFFFDEKTRSLKTNSKTVRP